MAVPSERAGEAERDERWSLGGHQGTPRWRWPAMEHHTGVVVAEVVGRRTAAGVVQRNAWLEPFGLTRCSPAHGGASTRHWDTAVPSPGKRHPQPSERQPRP